ncbi:TonB family protein [Polycyclovorans algicola]|uniref:TonB family protein n=1 Tax=Polycyclovorans algicola TaxID=616992 RepID=UPI0009FD0CAE|nr:TonB family protein [Polycyclovorans algicola]
MMSMIGKYTVLRELGAGGFGAVYLCDDPLLQEQVAVKVFQVRDANAAQQATSASGDASRILRERFLAEARVLRRLSANPHIVEVYDFAETVDGTPYYVMPYLSQTLVDEIGKDAMDPAVIADLPAELRPRKLPINRASIILDQVLDALSAVHKAGLIHRDIKPANILFNADGVVQLCDFGIAKLPDTDHSQTSSGMAMGSRNYMAPEQRESAKHVDARADVYAFGVLAYRVYTGAMPVGRFDDPIALSPALGKDLNELILSCLDQSKERRPADASVLRVRFKAALSAASGVPAAGAEDHSGTWVEAGRGEASYKASVSPLESRVEALLGEHGEIPQDAWHELNALAAIGSVSEGALQSLVEQVASRLGTPLEAKRNFLKHVDSLAARGTDLSAQRPALLAAAQAVGWDAAKVDAVIAARAPTQPAPTRAPTPSAGAVSPPPTHTIHPRARPSAPRATNKRSSARWVMAGLVLGVVGLAGALLGPPLSTRWAERADGADPAQAQSTPSAPASQLAAAPAPQRPPAGSDARPAPASTAAAPSQDRPAATPAETPEQRITALSRRLDTQVAGFKLTRPAGDNAAETLEQIKAINPDHPKVGEGTRAIAGKYLELFERDLAANDLPKAASYIALAEGFTPGSQAIEQAKAKMQQANSVNSPRQRDELADKKPSEQIDALLERWSADASEKVIKNLRNPPNLTTSARTTVLVKLTSYGDVLSAEVVRSSDSKPFDEAVLNAIARSSPLPRVPLQLHEKAHQGIPLIVSSNR